MKWAERDGYKGEELCIHVILVVANLKDRNSFQKPGIGRNILHEEIDLNPYPANVENMVSS
jgi:hypothetical protein